MLPNTEPLRGSKVTPVSEKGQGKGLLKKGHGSWAVGFEFGIILQCGCQYDSFVTFQLEVLTGYFWINFDCVFYFCAKCSICLKGMNFSAEWIHDCSRWIIYYQPTDLQDSFIHKSVLGRLSFLEKWIIANSTKNDLFPKCPADLTVYKSSHQAPFIFSDADYMKRNERKEACNRTLENRIMSYWSHQFLLDPFVDAVLVGSLPQRDGLANCCALYFSGWFLL